MCSTPIVTSAVTVTDHCHYNLLPYSVLVPAFFISFNSHKSGLVGPVTVPVISRRILTFGELN